MSNYEARKDDLSVYIKKQLSTLLKQVQQTPPKKSSSLKKIQSIVQKSVLSKEDKLQISRKIRKVEQAIERSKSVDRIRLKLKDEPKTVNKYHKNLFIQNLILEQKQLNLDKRFKNDEVQLNVKKQSSKQFLNLVETFENLRTQRLKYQNQIQSLSIKAQKLQRLISLKQQNQEKYQQQALISKKYHEKKSLLQNIRSQVKSAVKQNRKKMVSVLMKKYSQVQQS